MSTRFVALAATAAVVAATAACERRAPGAAEETEARLVLALETPETLHWGGTGILRLTLANQGDVAAAGVIVELYVPDWLEIGPVEPAGAEVRVVSGEHETRLSYPFADSILPGERRSVQQHLRVTLLPPSPAPTDTMQSVQLPPLNQTVRARLLTAAGEPVGAEVQATLNFVAGPVAAPPLRPPGDTFPRRDTLPRRDTVPRRDTLPPGDTTG
jgi:hypothetical protein